ncbi:hypothetical protein A7A08_00806 [Methyloligella halotolerans]|uniref:Uncharacterized protein n=1 Tax=Methyloligella halotolerans TaxID=1177755 RepID=A0A1E2S3F0_9HYPH|nr:hypothetical protein [Methyloligella halotolerans]ODA68971.1 hypothetical protein A7A08_00806 [Methyloligella halotolerans]
MTHLISASRILSGAVVLGGLALLAPALSGCSGGDPFCEDLNQIADEAKLDFVHLGAEKLPAGESNSVSQADGTITLPGMRRCYVTNDSGLMSYDCEVSFETKEEATAQMKEVGDKIVDCFDEVEADLRESSVEGVEDTHFTIPHTKADVPVAMDLQLFEHATYIVSLSIYRNGK